MSKRDWNVALLLSVLFGFVGADRFYLGRTILGILKLATFGGFFVWWAVDVVLLLQGHMRDDLGRLVQSQAGTRT